MRTYKHLFFDLDHTLWDFNRNAESALGELYVEFELNSTLNVAFDSFYEKYIYHNEILWARYQKGFISAEELKWRRMWRTMLDFKIADEALARKLSDHFLLLLPTRKEVFPHTFELLQYLSNKNYSIHLITNGFEKTQWSKLKHSGLEPYFTHVITSEKSNSLKPKKEIFDYALNLAKAGVSESLMIGDNLDADIAGAVNAGMDSVYVNHINAVHSHLPTYTVSHLQELENIL